MPIGDIAAFSTDQIDSIFQVEFTGSKYAVTKCDMPLETTVISIYIVAVLICLTYLIAVVTWRCKQRHKSTKTLWTNNHLYIRVSNWNRKLNLRMMFTHNYLCMNDEWWIDDIIAYVEIKWINTSKDKNRMTLSNEHHFSTGDLSQFVLTFWDVYLASASHWCTSFTLLWILLFVYLYNLTLRLKMIFYSVSVFFYWRYRLKTYWVHSIE